MRSPQTSVAARARAAVLVSIALACGVPTGTEPGSKPAPVARIDVNPPAPTVGVGRTVPLTASVHDAAGSIIGGRDVFWSSRDSSIASISPLGVVTGRTPGSVEVAASAGGKFAIATVTVMPKTVATVVVLPGQAETVVNGTLDLDAATYDDAGQLLAGRTTLWSSGNTAVATVDASGVVTGRSIGTATITATSEGRSGSAQVVVKAVPVATVVVSPPNPTVSVGVSLQLSAQTRDAQGSVLTGRAITWASSDESIASVSSTGLMTGRKAGTATITATSEGVSGSVTARVNAVVGRVDVRPSSAEIDENGTVQLIATVYDAQGNVLLGQTVTWSTSNAQIATVSQTGLVRGLRKGKATITATAGGKSDTSSIEVDD